MYRGACRRTQEFAENAEISFEIRYRRLIRLPVVNAQPAPHVEVRERGALPDEPLRDLIHLHAKIPDGSEVLDLGADVKMQSDKRHVREAAKEVNYRIEF